MPKEKTYLDEKHAGRTYLDRKYGRTYLDGMAKGKNKLGVGLKGRTNLE
jgi:hypothetical protein